MQLFGDKIAGYPVYSQTGYLVEYTVSGFQISRISGQNRNTGELLILFMIFFSLRAIPDDKMLSLTPTRMNSLSFFLRKKTYSII